MFLAHAVGVVLLATAVPAFAAGALRPRRISAARAVEHGAGTVFTHPLAALGEWVRLTDGRIAWRPHDVGDAWRPYLDGSWAWSEEGWYWVSDEPWAWATYHFGRWRFDARLGWIWFPGEEWAPSWVVWRVGTGAVGWAPRSDDGFVLPAHWTFLPSSRVAGVHVPDAAVHPSRVPALLLSSRELQQGAAGRAERDFDGENKILDPRVAGPTATREREPAASATAPAGAPLLTARRAAR